MADNRTGMVEVYGPGEHMVTRKGKRGIAMREQHKALFYKLDEDTGEIIEMRLPSDSPFYQQYLGRGFVTERSLLEKRSLEIQRKKGLLPVEESQEAPADKEAPHIEEKPEINLKCEVCGFTAKSVSGLRLHMKKHTH